MVSAGEESFVPAAVSFELDDELVLFAEHSGELFVLNSTAALIWEGLSQGLSRGEIADALAASAQRAREDLLRDIDALAAQWGALGLTGSGRPATPPASRPRGPFPWWKEEASVTAANAQPVVAASYRIVDFSFCLRTPDELAARRVHDAFEHLRVPGGAGSRPTLELFFEEGRWRLEYNGRPIDQCPDSEGLVPMVHGNVMMAACGRSASMVALHAAALGVGGQCVLLAGVPGSGKSTLTAALLARGFGYVADDTVLLTAPPVRVRGVPMRVGLKEGSWSVLDELWPQLSELPVHCRADGKRIRYFLPSPPVSAGGAGDALPAAALVFPRYRAGATTTMKRVRRAQALRKLAEAGYDVGGVLDRNVVRALVEWISGLDCYELVHGDLDEAVAQLAAIVR
jgi:hypothetical protein